jgi:PKD repeat protein/predicted secreted protein
MKKKIIILKWIFALTAILIIDFANGQNFVQITKSNSGQTIVLDTNQVLEIGLPSNPSTGYGWYEASVNNKNIETIVQTGDWEFIPYSNSEMVGQPGDQIIRFIGVSQGNTILKLEYKRPWEKNIAAVDVYTVIIVSEGKYTGSYTPPINQQSEQKHITSTPKSLPSSFSWQSQCTPINNQGQCGSCWAFAACGVFEANINIIDGVTKDLSEQWLINCNAINHGCQGGWFSPSVGDMFQNDGAVYESDLPYVNGSCNLLPADSDLTCIGICGTYPHYELIDSYAHVFGYPTPADADIKQAIYDYGPVWVTIDAGENFQNYSDGNCGIFTLSDGTTINHAVVLVGWKDTLLSNGSAGYWILRNSYGTSWGENGYMRIAYGVSAVGTKADYVVYKGGPITMNCDTIFPNSAYTGCFGINGNNLVYYSIDGNYVTGNNAYGDLEKAQKFIGTGGGEITSVYAYNIYISGTTDYSWINIWSVDPISGAPNTYLGYSNTISVNSSGYSLYQFSSPVTVPSDFFASVVLPTNSGDTIAVASTHDGCYSGDSLAWEMYSDYTWHSLEHDPYLGNLQIDLAIVPVLCNIQITPVVADFFADPVNICIGTSVDFYDLSSGNPTSWSWDFGDGNFSTSQYPSYTYYTAGIYSVSLTVSNGNSSDTYTINNYITVNPLPSIAATPNGATSLCQNFANTNYTTTGATYATSYVWSINPPSAGTITGTSTTGTVNWNAAYTGAATISVYGVNNCGNGATSNTLTVTVNPNPTANAGSDQNITSGQPAILTANSGGTSYAWSNGGSTQSITVYPTSTTTYTVTVYNSYGCSATDDVTVFVTGGALSVNATATPNSICLGSTVQLNANPTGGNGTYAYSWSSSPAGFSSAIQNPTATPSISTTYTVTVTSNGSTATAAAAVTVNPVPAQPTISAVGSLLTSSAATTYQWYFNGGLISGATSQTYTATQDGSYTVVVTNAYGCSNTSAPYNYNVTTAQPFVPEVVATAGDYFTGSSAALGWTIGEVLIETGTGTSNIITQGFHQADYQITTLVSETSDDYLINVYPNPASDNITVEIISRAEDNLKLKLYDAQGKLLVNEKIKAEEKTKILDLQNFSKGMYILNVYTTHGKLVKSYKIEKIK